jgi:putative acetyltransferase
MDEVVIRTATSDDFADIYEMMCCPGVIWFTSELPYPSEDDWRKRFLKERGPKGRILVAEIEGRVVGNLELSCLDGRQSHAGVIDIAVHDDFQNRGIGSALMRTAVDIADNQLGLKRLALNVAADNSRAIHLYEKFGFVNEGTHRAVSLRDGEYLDDYTMARLNFEGTPK